jgi:ribosomal protein L37AE/L43A
MGVDCYVTYGAVLEATFAMVRKRVIQKSYCDSCQDSIIMRKKVNFCDKCGKSMKHEYEYVDKLPVGSNEVKYYIGNLRSDCHENVKTRIYRYKNEGNVHKMTNLMFSDLEEEITPDLIKNYIKEFKRLCANEITEMKNSGLFADLKVKFLITGYVSN